MSTPTDDLEAKAREYLRKNFSADGGATVYSVNMLVGFARSLSHPKEVAPTVWKIMEVVDEWLWSCTPDNQHIRHPLGSKYRTDQPAQDALRARLKTLFP